MEQFLGTKKIWVIVGTRPEVIKQVPLYWALKERRGDSVALVGTGQHRELLDQALKPFDVRLDFNLDLSPQSSRLSETASLIFAGFDKLFSKFQPNWVVVQGDTTSAAIVAQCAFYNRIKVAHNEAGLRSHDLGHPFPEEANRKLITALASVNFAPTKRAQQELLKENISLSKIHLVGNTGVDSLLWMLKQPIPPLAEEIILNLRNENRKLVLLTAHRRENKGELVWKWFETLANFLKSQPDLFLVYPFHPNKIAKGACDQFLAPLPQVKILDPIDYPTTCHLLKFSHMVVTDSGGLQEEGATLGIPVVVCRKTTERAEAVELNLSKLADPEDPVALKIGLEWAFNLSTQERSKNQILKPFGDGRAANRICDLII